MPTKKALIKSTKFKVGDYLTANDKVFLRVTSVIDGALGPMYGMISPQSTGVGWMSQYECEAQELAIRTPDFEAFEDIEVGDILHVGQNNNRPYVTVLARVGDAVLLSMTPNKKLAQMLLKVDKVLKEASEDTGLDIEDLIDDEQMADLKRMSSSLHASKIAGDWMPIEKLALMNWDIVKE